MDESLNEVLLDGIVTDVRQRIGQIPFLTAVEREQVLSQFNDTAVVYPENRLIHELFEEQVQLTPGAIALIHEQKSLTYADLNGRANQLARYLVNQGVGPDQLVGICVGRSVEMVIGLLGVLKAGGAYLPLDPNYPPERLRYMLEDAVPRVVLTQEQLRAVLPATQAEVISLDRKLREIAVYVAENLQTPKLKPTARSLVYVIYTSGSTGRPKGTAMSHHSMVNLIEWHRKTLPSGEEQRVLQFAALSFDVAFQETFSTLCTGGTLVLLDEWVRRDARALAELLSRHSIKRLFVPPMVLQSLAETCGNTGAIPQSVRDVITAGEQLRITPEIKHLFRQCSGCRLHNHYGPTETHVVTALTLTGDPDEWPSLPTIGRPISNTRIYVLNAQQQPVPIGCLGEIYIGGVGVSWGYLRRPELTAQRFIADPFGPDPGARVYKTGDLGRWRQDGMLEYHGRNDNQVKIRGFRIELGEVEAQLGRHEQVRGVAVVTREDVPGEKRLVAYITVRNSSSPTIEEFRAHLRVCLPEHMVPSAFVTLDSFPVTPNGKLDCQALPAPDLEAYGNRQYEAPQGEVEEILAGVWQDLLRLERVGRHDDFFESGGHSLLVVQMMERLRWLGLSSEGHRVFESPTLADFAGTLTRDTTREYETAPNLIPHGCEALTPEMLPLVELKAEDIERIVRAVPGGAANIQDIYPLAPLQEGILFHHLLNEQGGDTYVLPMLLSLSSEQMMRDFIRGLQEVIDRHDILRTAVLWEQLPRPVQVVHRHAVLPVELLALDGDRDPIDQLRERMKPERQRLELRRAPLIRLQVAKDARGGNLYALLQLHHLVGDHESLEITLAEVRAHLEGRAQELPEPLPYRSHVAWTLTHDHARTAEAFFRLKLGDITEPTAPFGLLDIRGDGSRIELAQQAVDADIARKIRVQSRRLGVSAATLFHAAWALVVSRTSGRDDVVYGSLLLGRLRESAGAQRTLGMFINTLPLRLRLRDITAKELVERTHRELVELLYHEQASLAVAQRCSGIAGSTPLFSALLNYRHSTPNFNTEQLLTSGIKVLESLEWTNYPAVLSVDDLGQDFVLSVQTDRRIDPHRMMGYVSTALQVLVKALEQAPQTPALSLSILPNSERKQIIESFNATQSTYPRDKLLHELFEEQVRWTPEAIAVQCADRSLSYAELNRRANQLAHYLRGHGVGPDRTVAICVERSIEIVMGMLAIFKAGGAYVPLDPSYPAERLAYMLADSAPDVVLTQERLSARLADCDARLITLDTDWERISSEPDGNLVAQQFGLGPRHLSYVIYTSGSTGTPKGVMIEHRNLMNLLHWHCTAFSLSAGTRCSCVAAVGFDAFGWEVWPALTVGATVVLAPSAVTGDPEALLTWWSRELLDVSFLPTPMAEFAFGRNISNPKLHTLLVGGDRLHQRPTSLPFLLVNNYGPTESTVVATSGSINNADSVPHIGGPISNTQIYIVDTHLQPVPIGVAGEIYIGGASVARGYLKRPELTAERFLPDPFSADLEARMYKSGDLGRWRPDGTIEYLDRNDCQVKIRGFRIELGEIEAQLARHAHVKEAAVLAREDVPGEKRLVAYVVPQVSFPLETETSVEALRTHLRAVLPEHMVPSAFMKLERFPLTPNGKLDRRALPAPEPRAQVSPEYEPPQGEVEHIVASIWEALLHVERVSRQDNFFELGGHSLLATQVIVRIRSLLEVEIPVSAIFRFPTLGQLSAQVGSLRRSPVADEDTASEDRVDELFKRVASMPESEVQELLQELTMRGTS
jgi:amino acid adenylation domain-containing protein